MGSLLQGAREAAAPASGRARRARRPGRCYCLEGRGSGGAVRSPRARGGAGEPRRRGYNDLPPRLPRLLSPNSGANAALPLTSSRDPRGAGGSSTRASPVCGAAEQRLRGWPWTPPESGRVSRGGWEPRRVSRDHLAPPSPPSFPAGTPCVRLLQGGSRRAWEMRPKMPEAAAWLLPVRA